MKKRNGFVVMGRLVGLVKPLAGWMVLAITMGLIGNLCATFITVLGGYALLDALGQNAGIVMGAAFACMAVCALVRGVLRYAEQGCNHFIAFKLLALIRDRVFRALRRLCPAKLEGRDKGDLISVITSDIELLEVFYAHTISPTVIALLYCALLCLYIGSFHPLLGLLALLAYLTVGAAVPFVISRLGGDDGQKFRDQSGALSAYLLDSLRGLDETIQYGQGAKRLDGMNAQSERLSEAEARRKRNAGQDSALTNGVILLFDLVFLFAAVALHGQGALGFGQVLLAQLALMSSFGPCVALASLGNTLQNTIAAGNRVLDILEETPLVSDVTGQPEVSFTGAAAEHVTFSYGEETILKDFSVELPQGRVIGIVGKSGSGKSTLLKLLMRFWQVQEGTVSVSGRSVGEINTANLRSMEGYVTQQTHLFHDSIRNNLRIAKLDATDEELEHACKLASVHDFIMSLPQGYDTPVGELGDTLSGGERQRLGLARAFLHDAPFLLLDEPTSNLDSLNEAVILKALHEQRAGKTIVLVSHRQSTMRIADTVYSVENGRRS